MFVREWPLETLTKQRQFTSKDRRMILSPHTVVSSMMFLHGFADRRVHPLERLEGP